MSTSDSSVACMCLCAQLKAFIGDFCMAFELDQCKRQFKPSSHYCFVGRKCSEVYFHMQRSPYPGEELQTKHSFCRSPSPHRHRHDAWLALPAEKKPPHFFHQLLKAMQRGRRQNFRILKTMVSGKMHQAPSVRGRWANFRVTSANTNNCSGSLLLSALEVWVEFFNALQPTSLPLIFPLRMICLLPRPPSVFHSNTVRV